MAEKILFMFFTVMLVLSLCGCSVFTADTAELLSPPELSGDLKPIYEAIKKSADGEFTLKYPSRGNLRSAVVREDIDGDGSLEAFAFYSTADGETITMNLNAIVKTDKGFESVSVQTIAAGGVDKVEFCDLDGDGSKEILVGWEVYGTSEMQLAVYSMNGNALAQKMLQKYTHFTTCDLDENGESEIFIVKAYSTEQGNSASVYRITEDGISESSCLLDKASKTVNEPVLATLSDGRPCFYIDEIKGMGAITEVIYMENSVLVNPLFSEEAQENTFTLRSVSFSLNDIDGDGIYEIPVQEGVPSAENKGDGENLYLINWCSFDGSYLTNKMTAMMNVNDGYYLVIPPKWSGRIAVLKDTDNRVREIYSYNPDDMTVGESLIYIKAVKQKEWKEKYSKVKDCVKLAHNDETVFICKISDKAIADGITAEEIKQGFKFIE